MKIIDINAVIGKAVYPHGPATAEQLLRAMEQYGIDRSVISHELSKMDHKRGNDAAAAICGEHSDKFGFCARIDPGLSGRSLGGDEDLVAELEKAAPECIAIGPTEQKVPFTPFYWDGVLSAADRLNMPVLLDEPCELPLFRDLPEVAASYNHAKFVVCGAGLTHYRAILSLIKNTENVYFTTAKMLDNRQIEDICAQGGAGRLLFGTGYPDIPQSGPLGLVAFADIGGADKERILSCNWEAIGYGDR